MAGQMSIMLRADPSGFSDGIDDAIKAIRDWETQTGVSADNAADKLEDAIRAVIDLGRQTDRSADDMKKALQGLGLSAEDAEDAIAAIERETDDLGRQAPRDIERAEDAVDDLGDAAEEAGDKTSSIRDKASEAGDGLRDLGNIAKDVLKGDFGAAAASASDALGSVVGALTGGAIGGAIGSVLGGIVSEWVNSWSEAAKESEARINTWADRFIEANGRVLEEQMIMDEVARILTEDTELQADAMAISAATGVEYAEVLRALSGDLESLAQASVGARETDEEYFELMGKMAGRSYEISAADKERFDELQRGREALAKHSEEMDKGMVKTHIYADAAEIGRQKTKELNDEIAKAENLDITATVHVDRTALDNLISSRPRMYVQAEVLQPGEVRWQ